MLRFSGEDALQAPPALLWVHVRSSSSAQEHHYYQTRIDTGSIPFFVQVLLISHLEINVTEVLWTLDLNWTGVESRSLVASFR